MTFDLGDIARWGDGERALEVVTVPPRLATKPGKRKLREALAELESIVSDLHAEVAALTELVRPLPFPGDRHIKASAPRWIDVRGKPCERNDMGPMRADQSWKVCAACGHHAGDHPHWES